MEQYLKEKRDEFIWALSEQGYTGSQIAKIFGTDRMTVKRTIDRRPADYRTKWVKVL